MLNQIKNMIFNRILIIIVIVIITVGSGYYLFQTRKTDSVVKTISPARKDIQAIVTIDGKIEAEKKIDLVFKIVGRIVYLPVKKGQTVNKWQTLASIDPSDLKANQDLSLEDYMTARWELEQEREDYQVKNNLQDASLTDEEKRKIEKKQFSLNKSVTNVEIAARAVKDAYIYAPFDGVITDLNIEEGNYTLVGQPAMTIQTLTDLRLRAFIPENEVGKTNIGDRVEFTLDAFSGKKFTGEISEIEAYETVINNIVYYRATIKPDLVPDNIKSGMSADITIETEKKTNVLTLPLYAFKKIDGDVGKVKIKEGDKVVERELRLGLEGKGGVVEVVSGIKGNEMVVIDDLPIED